IPPNYVLEPPAAQLSLPAATGDYEVVFACLGDGRMGDAIKAPDRLGVLLVPNTPCDGTVTRKPFQMNGSAFLCLVSDAPGLSWRVVVRRLTGSPSLI